MFKDERPYLPRGTEDWEEYLQRVEFSWKMPTLRRAISLSSSSGFHHRACFELRNSYVCDLLWSQEPSRAIRHGCHIGLAPEQT